MSGTSDAAGAGRKGYLGLRRLRAERAALQGEVAHLQGRRRYGLTLEVEKPYELAEVRDQHRDDGSVHGFVPVVD
jgi:hypothetical protein